MSRNSIAGMQYHGRGVPSLSTAFPTKALRKYPVVKAHRAGPPTALNKARIGCGGTRSCYRSCTSPSRTNPFAARHCSRGGIAAHNGRRKGDKKTSSSGRSSIACVPRAKARSGWPPPCSAAGFKQASDQGPATVLSQGRSRWSPLAVRPPVRKRQQMWACVLPEQIAAPERFPSLASAASASARQEPPPAPVPTTSPSAPTAAAALLRLPPVGAEIAAGGTHPARRFHSPSFRPKRMQPAQQAPPRYSHRLHGPYSLGGVPVDDGRLLVSARGTRQVRKAATIPIGVGSDGSLRARGVIGRSISLELDLSAKVRQGARKPPVLPECRQSP
jgi:hypothetical protein